MRATQKNDLEIMKLLIDAGARVNEKDVYSTPLMWTHTPEAAKLLLDRGANPRIRDDETDLTAWQQAKRGHTKETEEIARVIMEYENRTKGSF